MTTEVGLAGICVAVGEGAAGLGLGSTVGEGDAIRGVDVAGRGETAWQAEANRLTLKKISALPIVAAKRLLFIGSVEEVHRLLYPIGDERFDTVRRAIQTLLQPITLVGAKTT